MKGTTSVNIHLQSEAWDKMQGYCKFIGVAKEDIGDIVSNAIVEFLAPREKKVNQGNNEKSKS